MKTLIVQRKITAHWLTAATISALGIVAYVFAFLIVNREYRYMVGVVFLIGLFFTTFKWRRWELVFIGFLALDFIWEYVIGEGWWYFAGFLYGHAQITLVTLIVLYLAIEHGGGDESRGSPVSSALFAGYAVCLLISMLVNHEPVHTMNTWIQLGLESYLVFWFARRVLASEQRVGNFLLLLFALGTLFSLEMISRGLWGRSNIPDQWQTFGKVYSLPAKFGLRVPYPNFLFAAGPFDAAWMVAMLPIGLELVLNRRRNKILRGICLLASVSMLINIVILASRAAWLASACSLIFLLSWHLLPQAKWRPLFALGAALGLVGLLLFTFVLTTLQPPVLSSGLIADVLPFSLPTDRWYLWLNTLEALPHVLLSGIGYKAAPDAFPLLLARYSHYGYPGQGGLPHGHFDHPHNSYLDLLVSFGLPPFFFFIALVLYVFRKGLTGLGSKAVSVSSQALPGVFASLVGLSIAFFFDRTLLLSPFNHLFWTMMGCTLGLACRLTDRPQSGVTIMEP